MARRVINPPQEFDGTIRKFEPSYWHINFPLPVAAGMITPSSDAITVKANFYQNTDNVALIWESKDSKDAPLFAYETNRNYRDCTLSFDFTLTAGLRAVDAPNGMTLTVKDDVGKTYIVRLENYRTSGTGTAGTIVLPFNTVKGGYAEDVDIPWERIEELFLFIIPDDFGTGQSVTTSSLSDGATSANITVPNGVDVNPGDVINFQGATSSGHVVTSFTSGANQTISFTPAIEAEFTIASGADVVVTPMFPSPITKVKETVTLTNISVTGPNSTLGINTTALPAHDIRMTDGYDNAYPFAPERIVDQMIKLGYRNWYVIYVGISHHHSLTYDPQEYRPIIDRAVTNTDPVVNEPADLFFSDLFTRLHAAGFKIVVSLSYEVLDEFMPYDWGQKDLDGFNAATGWTPPSSLVTPSSSDALNYIRDVYIHLLTMIDNLAAPIYFQIGEPWWWDGSFSPTIRKPFIYDQLTQDAYVAATGNAVPTPFLANVHQLVGVHADYLNFCQQQLGSSTDYLRDQIKLSFPTATSMLLIFTPQFLNTTEPMLRLINLPISNWKFPNYDIVQIEDYDEIVKGNYDFILQQTVHTATVTLGYPIEDVHYFVGFNLLDQTSWVWNNIDEALFTVRDLNLAERFVWSREQVLRDGWVYSTSGWKYLKQLTTLALCWKITRKDGQVFRFTTHDQSITVNSEEYVPTNTFAPGSITFRSDTSPDQINLAGIFSSEVTEADLILGLYEDAQAEIFTIDYTDPNIPQTTHMRGWLGQTNTDNGGFGVEFRSLSSKFVQTIGETYTPQCRVELGSAQCGVDLSSFTVSGTVDFVPGATAENLSRPPGSSSPESPALRNIGVNLNDHFVSFSINEAAGYYDFGLLTWTSGNNIGLSMEVLRQDANQLITLMEEMPNQISEGDSFTLSAGCDKSRSTCISKFNNLNNFRGFPDVPGTDAVLEFPDAKSS